jgi:Domain of unknown function (DUF4410)
MKIWFRARQPFGPICLVALFVAGCGTSEVTPVFATSDTLVRPDRILVYDFAVTPSEYDLVYGADTRTIAKTSSQTPSPEDVQMGRAFAKALSEKLVDELRGRGIAAYRASEATPPGDSTASIKGRFIRMSQTDQTLIPGFGVADGQVRANLQILQGSELRTRVVAEAETSTRSNLRPGLGLNLQSTIEADAKQTASEVAERIVDYYKRRGWID